ncbi:MAG: hypothetical protein AM1032_000373 [Mycoplasmataceae bacterium]|nr:MAG: hypothetical protein AM1032_000373 [Mycoplasmataceae bacterium]
MIIINPKYVSDLENKDINDIKKLTNLSLHNRQLSGFVFVKDFPNLESLDLDWNYIDKFNIDNVSSNNLKNLSLGGNYFKYLDNCLTNIDIKKLTSLSLNDNYLNIKLDYFVGCNFLELNLGNRNDNKRKLRNSIADKETFNISQIAKKFNLDNTDFNNNLLEEVLSDEICQSLLEHQEFQGSSHTFNENELIDKYSIFLIFANLFKWIFEKIKNIVFYFKLVIENFSYSFDIIRNYTGLKRIIFFTFIYFIPLNFFLFFNIFKKLKIEYIKDKKSKLQYIKI